VRWLKLFFLAVLVLSSTTASARFTASLLPRERLEEKGFSEKLSLLEKAAQVLEKSRIEAEPPTCSLSPFGELIRSSGPLAQANPFRFSTKYWDQESDLVYYGFRYYSPSLGRWISRDPIEEGDGPNIYGLVWNEPINALDALGMNTLAEEEGVAEAGASMGSGGAGQAIGILNRVRNMVDTFNEIQEFTSDLIDASDGDSDDLYMDLLQAAAKSLAGGIGKKAGLGAAASIWGPQHGGKSHWDRITQIADAMKRKGWGNIRVNRQQVDAAGKVVGKNRPDLSAINPRTGKRVNIEIDTKAASSANHRKTVNANDPSSKNTYIVLP